MVTRIDYPKNMVEAARSVMVELTHLLGEYREHIVVVGGWVPELLFPRDDDPHVGSIDVDLAIDHKNLSEEHYRTIERLLLDRGYQPGRLPFQFVRTVTIGDREVRIEVDFLAGEYEGTGKRHRHQRIKGIKARKARGCDLAFHKPVEITVEGRLPDGGLDEVNIRVASVVPFLAMKGFALEGRMKSKDAYDIYYCVRNYLGGVDALVEAVRSYLGHSLVREGLESISRQFASEEHWGPRAVADFEDAVGESREMIQRDAFERVNYLLSSLGEI